ncbi:putative non-specific serine/threonine protein kinase [Medicago truncatula]|uniref:Putative non-specific serine/threonine protein kinase n=1 Tax=Medicago truncatula TaxID=3880 RepID=A0A396IQ48_MEDTR|nr:putative non-specific serine/threonine protein kinase [Medicago truncatula]
MLFGRRPFGHDQTQERILREDTIIKARKVEFPARPTVSNEAKVILLHENSTLFYVQSQLASTIYLNVQILSSVSQCH